ncbi:hypothetical protein ACFSHQ_15330 [Gemmobacter lanyuensis]
MSFALVSGGHNTGIVAAPGNPRASFRLMQHRPGDHHPAAEDWAAATPRQTGSWWAPWADWLVRQDGGAPIAPPPWAAPIWAMPRSTPRRGAMCGRNRKRPRLCETCLALGRPSR